MAAAALQHQVGSDPVLLLLESVSLYRPNVVLAFGLLGHSHQFPSSSLCRETVLLSDKTCLDVTFVALNSRRAEERRRKRFREQQEDEADREAEAAEKRHRNEADAASSGADICNTTDHAGKQLLIEREKYMVRVRIPVTVNF